MKLSMIIVEITKILIDINRSQKRALIKTQIEIQGRLGDELLIKINITIFKSV